MAIVARMSSFVIISCILLALFASNGCDENDSDELTLTSVLQSLPLHVSDVYYCNVQTINAFNDGDLNFKFSDTCSIDCIENTARSLGINYNDVDSITEYGYDWSISCYLLIGSFDSNTLVDRLNILDTNPSRYSSINMWSIQYDGCKELLPETRFVATWDEFVAIGSKESVMHCIDVVNHDTKSLYDVYDMEELVDRLPHSLTTNIGGFGETGTSKMCTAYCLDFKSDGLFGQTMISRFDTIKEADEFHEHMAQDIQDQMRFYGKTEEISQYIELDGDFVKQTCGIEPMANQDPKPAEPYVIYEVDAVDLDCFWALSGIVDLIELRLETYGIGSWAVQRWDDNCIAVRLDGIEDFEDAISVLGASQIGEIPPIQFAEFIPFQTDIDGSLGYFALRLNEDGFMDLFEVDIADAEYIAIPASAEIDGELRELTSWEICSSPFISDIPRIELELTSGGSELCWQITSRLSSKPYESVESRMGLFIESEYQYAPTVSSPIRDYLVITGLTEGKSNELINLLKTWRLTTPLRVIEEAGI